VKTHVSEINPTINADASFDWKMTKNVLFFIKNAEDKVIRITSSDGEIQYHKGFSAGQTYNITVTLPVDITQILINDQWVEVSGKVVVFTFPQFKDTELTGNAVCFNGASAYGLVNNGIVTRYPFTMTAWIKPEPASGQSTDMVVFSFGVANNDNKQIGIYLSYSETGSGVVAGTFTMRLRTNTPLNFYSDVVAEPGTWYHVAAVFYSKNNRKLYINGVLEGTHTSSLNFPSGINRFNVARWADKTPDSYFNGTIDEVKIWNYARSAAQVLSDMNDAFTGNETGLIGFWPFEENSGFTSADHSPNNRTMVLNSGVQWCQGNTYSDTDNDGIQDEEDDFPDDPLRAFNNYWPPQQATLAFEDLWPSIADYDFNDLIIGYLFNSITNANNELVEVYFNFEVKATGAGLENGFGFSLPDFNVPSGNFLVSGFQADNGITSFNTNGTEAGQTFFTIIPFDVVPWVGNTRVESPYITPVDISIKLEITGGGPYFIDDIGFESFNPFLFVKKVRSHEIHMADYPPTDLMDFELFRTQDDASSPPATWYKSYDNLPWGLNFPNDFAYTREKDTIWEGHLKFIDWVNSKGNSFSNWYTDQPGYRNMDYIYSPPE